MKATIAILDNVNLLPETKKQLQTLANSKLIFPTEMEASEQDLITRTGNAEIVLISVWTTITERYLAACPSVKYIGLCGTSTAKIDLEAIKKRGITFSNVRDYGDEPASEYMFMLLLMLARGEGKYQWHDMPRELMGKSIGIVGMGALGKATAYLARGFKMNVSYYSIHRKPEWEEKGVKYADLYTLLKTCDVVAISTPTDVKVLGKEEFAAMKPYSVLMYLSVGEALDDKAFEDWIAKDNHFALFNYTTGDRYYQAFKNLPRVIFPKVVAAYTLETKQRLGQKVIENLQNYISKSPKY